MLLATNYCCEHSFLFIWRQIHHKYVSGGLHNIYAHCMELMMRKSGNTASHFEVVLSLMVSRLLKERHQVHKFLMYYEVSSRVVTIYGRVFQFFHVSFVLCSFCRIYYFDRMLSGLILCQLPLLHTATIADISLYYVTDASLQDLRGIGWLVVVIYICKGSGLLRVIVCYSSDKFISFESLSLDWVTLHCFLL